ncbi:MAG: hypothetical protein JJU40_16350 [Rhodobacteraceae bacterium]|nr:hypothetical protein [Paracoccaceae bacterium]
MDSEKIKELVNEEIAKREIKKSLSPPPPHWTRHPILVTILGFFLTTGVLTAYQQIESNSRTLESQRQEALNRIDFEEAVALEAVDSIFQPSFRLLADLHLFERALSRGDDADIASRKGVYDESFRDWMLFLPSFSRSLSDIFQFIRASANGESLDSLALVRDAYYGAVGSYNGVLITAAGRCLTDAHDYLRNSSLSGGLAEFFSESCGNYREGRHRTLHRNFPHDEGSIPVRVPWSNLIEESRYRARACLFIVQRDLLVLIRAASSEKRASINDAARRSASWQFRWLSENRSASASSSDHASRILEELDRIDSEASSFLPQAISRIQPDSRDYCESSGGALRLDQLARLHWR